MSNSTTVGRPTVIRSGDELALAVLIRDGNVTAAAVRRRPLRVTGFYRGSKDGPEAWDVPALLTTLRRKLRVDADVRTVVLVEPAGTESDRLSGGDPQGGGGVTPTVGRGRGDCPAGTARVLIPPDLADQLGPDSDLRAIAAAVVQLN